MPNGYVFEVRMSGIGSTPEEAWKDALRNLSAGNLDTQEMPEPVEEFSWEV